ncbi:MAG: HAMP domain-containing histidine kinase [Eubacteriaceae bacterium]|nr:HAMP domain-containing histidine kinase [Eubacteriaceae bacterium]
MKNKILFRLISYFVTSFIIFALIIGVIFTTFFSRHNTAVLIAELEKRAVNVSATLSEMLEWNVDGKARQGTGFGAYLRFIEDISMNEVWVVYCNLEPITCGNEECTDHAELLNKGLPGWAAEIVLRAIGEKALVSESNNALLEAASVVAAAPIVLVDDNVIGAVLLRSHVSDADDVTHSGVVILFSSMAFAVLISVFIAVVLSSRFTNPLGKMKKTAVQISGGDYAAKTGVKQLDEIGELASAMDDMSDKLEAASQEHMKLDKLRRDYIANISHELRTPVTVIRGSLEALCDGVVSDAGKVAEYYNQMLSESVYLERLVSDMLDLARLQNLDFAIEVEDVDLKEVVEDVIRGMRRIAEKKRVNLALACDGESFAATGDYARLRQMIIIILDNAIKFSPEGGMVDIALSQSDAGITVHIRDKGCGISPDELPNIFERFYKQRSEENKTGTGLGLAIAKQIADRLNVKIDVTSAFGTGTEFALLFHERIDTSKA